MAIIPRIMLNTGRLIISKPGIDATANPSDANKVFDSDWAFGGAIIASGWYQGLYEGVGGAVGNHVINFPATLDYKPSVLLFDMVPPGSYTGGNLSSGLTVFGPYLVRYNPVSDPNAKNYQFATVTTSQIIIPYLPRVGSGFNTITAGNYNYTYDAAGTGTRYRAFAYCIFAI
ncbi:hypothetical protein LB517_28205 [Mesorhizobium sp. BR1-1-12]|uniref:hypothetical protein n=1 Tax=unclassified Mesorhizobium TaxID=325217 RepID=UPI00112D3352|nr:MULTISPECIES: hypothetical protein [unclassified Mesorhizobium]MBZ9973517.1 hypothetical protein [Mesorhizobium sp. BR1-1-12]TPL36755.1 hypothetical protein FJ947_10910 [Mesorhizobium sp. B2-4-8]